MFLFILNTDSQRLIMKQQEGLAKANWARQGWKISWFN